MIHLFHEILTAKYIHGIMFVIQSDLQGRKVNSKVKFKKILCLTNTSKCNTFFGRILSGESIYGIILGIQGHSQDVKVNSRDTISGNMIFYD